MAQLILPQQRWVSSIERSTRPQGVPQDHFLALNRSRQHSRPGVWIPLQFWDWSKGSSAFRTIGWNEVVVDIDDTKWSKVYDASSRVRDFLRSRSIPHYPHLSGGKGVHISIFLDADPTDVGWKAIRHSVSNWIEEESGVHFDQACVKGWSDASKGHLLRTEGGIRWHKPRFLHEFGNGPVASYKSMVRDIPPNRLFITQRSEAVVPQVMKLWKVPDDLITPLPEEEKSVSPLPSGIFSCVGVMVEELKLGRNLSHFERVAVATYALASGMSDEDICGLFVRAPDFSASTTTYYVRHLRSKGYKPPSHKTIQENGVCRCS